MLGKLLKGRPPAGRAQGTGSGRGSVLSSAVHSTVSSPAGERESESKSKGEPDVESFMYYNRMHQPRTSGGGGGAGASHAGAKGVARSGASSRMTSPGLAAAQTASDRLLDSLLQKLASAEGQRALAQKGRGGARDAGAG